MKRAVAPVVLAIRAAVFAPLGSLEIPLCVELLFPVGECERSAAIAASKLLISHTDSKRRKIKC